MTRPSSGRRHLQLGVAAVVAPLLESAGIAMISPGNTNPSLTIGPDRDAPQRQFDNYFRMVANDAQQGGFLAAYAVRIWTCSGSP